MIPPEAYPEEVYPNSKLLLILAVLYVLLLMGVYLLILGAVIVL